MTPLEAVARALANLRGCFGEVDDIWPDYETDARTALTALRDCGVSDHMLAEAQEYEHITRIEAEHVMRAMLDAALLEG